MKIIFVLSLFHLVYCKTLPDVGAGSERKAMRQQFDVLGRKFRVISVKTTYIFGDQDPKNFAEEEIFCHGKKALLPTVLSKQQKADFKKDSTSKVHWLGATRNYTWSEDHPLNYVDWEWPGGELLNPMDIPDKDKEKDEHNNCLTLHSDSKYKDEECSKSTGIYPACELHKWRRFYLIKDGNSEVKIKNTFILVLDPNIEYDMAEHRCKDLEGSPTLADFHTERELRAIDNVFRGNDVYFHENETEWRFWIGAKLKSYHDDPSWNTGDIISKTLRTTEDTFGLCLHYHLWKQEGTLHSTFAWTECRPNDSPAGVSLTGYICKMHKAFIR